MIFISYCRLSIGIDWTYTLKIDAEVFYSKCSLRYIGGTFAVGIPITTCGIVKILNLTALRVRFLTVFTTFLNFTVNFTITVEKYNSKTYLNYFVRVFKLKTTYWIWKSTESTVLVIKRVIKKLSQNERHRLR